MKMISKIKKSELRKLYEENKLSMSQIAKIYNCSYCYIWEQMKKLGIKSRTLSEANKLNMIPRKIRIPKERLEELYIKQKLPTTKIAKMFNCHHSVVLRRMKEYNIKSRPLYEAMTIYPKKNFSGDLLEKAYMIGFRLGDLWVKRINRNGRTILIQGNSTRSEQIDLIEKLFGTYGHFRKSLVKDPQGKDETRISFYLNDSFSFLLENNKRIDDWILENNECFFAFLAGYIDAEGHIGVHKHGGMEQAGLQISTCDKVILHQIWSKLHSIGVEIPKPRIQCLKGYVSKKKLLPYRKDYWTLNTFSKLPLSFLLNRISHSIRHEKRLSDLNHALDNINTRNEKFGNLRMV